MKQLLTSLGLVVDDDPLLLEHGSKHCKRLRTTVPRKAGTIITSYYGGTYRERLPKAAAFLDCIQITVPGDARFLKASARCPAVFANDPTFSEETKPFDCNCTLEENETEGYNSHLRITLTCSVDIR